MNYQRSKALTVPKHVLRNIYIELTGDALQDENKEIEGVSKPCCRPQTLKGRPGDTFKVFFDTMETKIDEIFVADERRHGVAHLSYFISLRDPIEQITKDCPTGTPIPIETTVLFAFTPKNAYIKTAKLYKSQFQLKLKVKSRQFRASHVDDHYCAAQFRCMRQYALNNREVTTFLCSDDKSKIDYEEPNPCYIIGRQKQKVHSTSFNCVRCS